MMADELRAWILDEAEKLVVLDDVSDQHRDWLRRILVTSSLDDPGALERVAIPHDLLGRAM
jgi:hypothetical protein